MKFSHKDLIERFKVRNNETLEVIEVCFYSKLSMDGRYYDEYRDGAGHLLTPIVGSDNQFVDMRTDEKFTRTN